MSLEEIAESQRHHWKQLAEERAGTVQAVGSESMIHKRLRYQRLAEIFSGQASISVHDVGPGVGDFYAWLQEFYPNASNVNYSASEITPEYCEIASRKFPGISFHNRDILQTSVEESYDYVILSGVFHQQGGTSHREWIRYMQHLLEASWKLAKKGMAFNLISSGADFYKPGNFYADFSEVQLFIQRHLSRFFRMDCAYPLFEGTFMVYRTEYVREQFQAKELAKYMSNE